MRPETRSRASTSLLFSVLFALLALLLAACGGKSSLDDAASTGPGNGATAGSAGAKGGSGGAAGSVGGSGGVSGGAAGASGKPGKGGHAGGGAAGSPTTGGSGGSTAGAAGSGGAPPMLVSIEVSPATTTIAPGTNALLVATALYSDGSKADVTKSAAWTSSNAMVANVAGGLVTAVAPGSTTIGAALLGKSGMASVTVTSATPVGLQVTPTAVSLGVNATAKLTATLFLSDGTTQDVSTSASWSSDMPATATVDTTGVVTGVGPGLATITAQLGALSSGAHVSVTNATLTSIALSPVNPTIGVGVSLAFSAIGTYSDGSVADVTATSTWASSDPSALSIDAKAHATGLAAGTSLVTATLGGIVGSTTVTITPATLTSITVAPASANLGIGGTVQLAATAQYSDGSTVDVTTSATWSAAPSGVVTVSNGVGSEGLVTGVGAGTSMVTATLSGTSGSATITVTQASIASIAITPASATLGKGTTVQLKAVATYTDGTTSDVTQTASWSCSATTIATVSNAPGAGLVTGVMPGMATVQASLGGQTGSAAITVTSAIVQSIQVTPATMTLAIGKKDNFHATAVYSDGTTVDVTTLGAWSSSDPNVADVSNASGVQGQATAIGQGTATVTATFMGISGTATITVTQPTLAMLQLSPVDPTRAVGQTQQFQAIAIFTNGTQQNVTGQATWSSSNASVATIGNGPGQSGRAKAISAGTTTIGATWMGASGTTTLTVSDATVMQIQLSPIDPTFVVGVKAAFQATAIFTDGTSMNVTGQSTWTSSDPTVAQVTTNGGQKGRVTTLAPGMTDISATYMGVTGSTTVTVTSAVVMSISVSPATATIASGAKLPFQAAAIFSDGTSMDVTNQATWTSDTTSVAQVQTNGGMRGLATGISPGTAQISATYMGVTGSATLTVTSATIQSIQISPPNPSTGVGVKVKLYATAIFSDGTSMDVTPQATWVSEEPTIAQVSDTLGSKGLVTPLAPGDATIQATFQGVSGTTTVTVKSATLTTIQVTPFMPTLPVGYTTQFQAVGIWSDNSTQDLTGQVTWVSTAASIAAVSDAPGSKGRVDPVAAGTAQIQATYGGVTGSSTVTVTSQALQSIAITPASPSVTAGQSLQLTATGDFGGGLVLDITNYVTWLSSDTTVANVSNAPGTHGMAYAFASGSTTISATRDGVTGTTTLNVP